MKMCKYSILYLLHCKIFHKKININSKSLDSIIKHVNTKLNFFIFNSLYFNSKLSSQHGQMFGSFAPRRWDKIPPDGANELRNGTTALSCNRASLN